MTTVTVSIVGPFPHTLTPLGGAKLTQRCASTGLELPNDPPYPSDLDTTFTPFQLTPQNGVSFVSAVVLRAESMQKISRLPLEHNSVYSGKPVCYMYRATTNVQTNVASYSPNSEQMLEQTHPHTSCLPWRKLCIYHYICGCSTFAVQVGSKLVWN